jgi:hypothetical protein
MNETRAVCKCFKDFSGTNCEIMSTAYVVKKSIISGTTIIAICVMVSYAAVIICFDYTKYCLKRNYKKEIQKAPEIRRFQYKPTY